MQYFLLINFLFLSNAYSMFRSSECINSDFESYVTRDGALFGLMDYSFNLEKKRCVLIINHKDILSSKWTFDICREPVHLKVKQYLSEKVYIKTEECFDKTENTFCRKTKEILGLIQREGLINAKGERSSLETEHGKFYCIFKLLKKHLEDETIFLINGSKNPSIFEGQDLVDILPKIENIDKKIKVIKEAVVDKAIEIKKNVQQSVSEGLEAAGEKLKEAKENLESF